MENQKEIISDGGTIRTRLIRVEESGDGRGTNQREYQEKERPREPWKGEYVKSMVYAGLDAIVTCFSLISSLSATERSSVEVLVLGLANLVADGISMGLGDYVSSSTEKEVGAKERDATDWDVTNHSTSQRRDLVQHYQALGMDINDANTVVEIFAKYKDIFVDEKMSAEKGMLPPDQADKPWKNGLVTFSAFLLFGSLPLLSFIILIPFTDSDTVMFIGACVMAALALALLGVAKATIAGQSYLSSAVITLGNGAIAAAAAYAIGWTLRNVAGLKE